MGIKLAAEAPMGDMEGRKAPSALIIDDQLQLADLLAERLALDGFETTVATRGGDGLAAATHRSYDVAFVDLRLPDMSGLIAAAELKRQSAELKVILVTGFAASVDDLEPGWSNVDGVLPKPWRPGEMETILSRLRRGNQ